MDTMVFVILLAKADFSGIVVEIIFVLVQHAALSNCCINAFLYAWRSKPFYRAYKKLLCTRCAAA